MFHSNGLMQVAVLLVAGSAFTANTAHAQTSGQDQAERPSWGALDATGSGFLIGRTEFGEMTLSGYAVIRYINQLPATQTFVDHLGNLNVVDPRNDIQFHRAMLPFWLANDRVMADEFFRPGFTGTAWVNGEVSPGLWYPVAAGNSLSQLGFTAKQLTRDIATGAMVWWMPTTKEFGPNGSFDDRESHERLATRFGVSSYRSRENLNPYISKPSRASNGPVPTSGR